MIYAKRSLAERTEAAVLPGIQITVPPLSSDKRDDTRNESRLRITRDKDAREEDKSGNARCKKCASQRATLRILLTNFSQPADSSFHRGFPSSAPREWQLLPRSRKSAVWQVISIARSFLPLLADRGEVLFLARDHLAGSTVCFRVPPALFYSSERRGYLRPHSSGPEEFVGFRGRAEITLHYDARERSRKDPRRGEERREREREREREIRERYRYTNISSNTFILMRHMPRRETRTLNYLGKR